MLIPNYELFRVETLKTKNMLYTGYGDPPPEKYSDYKNRAFEKMLNRAKVLANNVKASSLNEKDKARLLGKIKTLF